MRTVLALLAVFAAGIGAAIGLAAAGSDGTVTACATATAQGTTVRSHTVALDGTDIYTVPAVTVPDNVAVHCETVTLTASTDTTQTTTPTTTTGTTTTVPPVTTPPPSGTTIDQTQGPGQTQANDDLSCAAQVFQSTWEPVPSNNLANNSLEPGPSSIPWSNIGIPPSFKEWYLVRAQIDGQYTGTTDEILQWASCKWGIDPNLQRAVAVQESDWDQASVGDNCGRFGEASYGIMQVKNMNCSGVGDWGGYPDTQLYTAVAADAWAAAIRACINGDFDQGWLPFTPQTADAYVQAHGLPYVIWGCVGFWFSGDWYGRGAQSYIGSVQRWLAQQQWLSPNGP